MNGIEDYDATIAEADRLRTEGRTAGAARLYEAASLARPDRLYPLFWLAFLLAEMRDVERALECGARGLAIDPDQIGLLMQMGTLAAMRRDPYAALHYFERGRELDPEIPEVDALIADQLCKLGRADEGAAAYERALRLAPASGELRTALLFCLNLSDNWTPDDIAARHRVWGEAVERRVSAMPTRAVVARPRVIRIGYVSPDLRAHGVSYFLTSLFENRDRSRFEHTVFDTSLQAEDAFTARLRASGVQWHKCASMNDDSLAELVRERSIDVLVDLSGHTAGHRLEMFARKPAPVQATWLGYLGTTGLTRMDYRFTDAYMDPPGLTESLHTERLVRLPVHACFTDLNGAPAANPSPAVRRGAVTFGSVNQWSKVSPATREVWAELLRRNAGARLCVVARGGQNPAMRAMIVEEFARRGAAREQVEVYPFLETPEYYALLGSIDVALDPFPYGGGTTTFQCLWAGVPVVSLAGRTPLSRNAIGPLNALGLVDLVAHSASEYVDIANRLGRDLPRLERARATLRERMRSSVLMNGDAFARSFESACERMVLDLPAP